MTRPTVTDEGRRLLEGIGTLPWTVSEDDDGYAKVAYRGDGVSEAVHTHVATFPVPREANVAAFAVSHLPAFLAAVEALRELYDEVTDGWGDDYTDAMRAARAALAPFTEEPTDAS